MKFGEQACQHGIKCYRRNPRHLVEYSHPELEELYAKWKEDNLTTIPSIFADQRLILDQLKSLQEARFERKGSDKESDSSDPSNGTPSTTSSSSSSVNSIQFMLNREVGDLEQWIAVRNVVGIAMENDRMIKEYETLISDLLKWIQSTIDRLGEREFAQLGQFNNYRTVEKPPKFNEKGNLELLLFTLQSRMRANNQKPYTPPEGKMISDMNKVWDRLEKAEHKRELALREELIRQEKLEQLAARFNRKASMRETGLSEKQRLVSQDNFGYDLQAVEAAGRKHEVIEKDIFAYEKRVLEVVAVALELEAENYYDIERINLRKENVLSQGDIGHDLTTVHLLLAKQKDLEHDLSLHEPQFMGVVSVGQDLIETQQFGADKVQERLQEITNLWQNLKDLAELGRKRLTEAVDYHQFFTDADDVDVNMLDMLRLVSSEDVGRDEANVHSLLRKHEDVSEELANYASTIDSLQSQASELGEQDRNSPEVQDRLASINRRYKELIELASLRKQRLLDAGSLYKLLSESEGVEQWLNEKDRMLSTMIPAKDIEDVEILKHRYDGFEKEMNSNASRVAVVNQLARGLLQVEHPNSEEIVARQNMLNTKWSELRDKAEGKRDKLSSAHGLQSFHIECRDKLKEAQIDRKMFLEKKKEALHFRRDVEYEKLWCSEKMPLENSSQFGNSLYNVHLLKKKNQSLRNEIENHEPRIFMIIRNGQKLIDEGHEDSEEFDGLNHELKSSWDELKDAIDRRKEKLLQSERAQQYLFDASESEAYMSEQELYMMDEDRGKDEISAQNLIKKHEALENVVNDYADTIRGLGETARNLIMQEHPESDNIGVKQAQVDKLYAGLKDLAHERRSKLEEALKLFMLNREVGDLEQWIAEREVVASSHELGQNYDHVTMLLERFKEFARDTESIGNERVALVNEMADGLILSQHSDGGTVEEWKDGLNEAWADLVELIDTRTQMLVASRELHKFFHDCNDVLLIIAGKQTRIPDEVGRDAGSVSALQRKHVQFLQDLQILQSQVGQVQDESKKLQAAYAGERAKEITNREAEVLKAWVNLQNLCEARRSKLEDTGDLFKFFNMVRTLMLWMDDVMIQMNTSEKPRYVSGVELLMNNHQSLKAEVDAREDNFSGCFRLGKELLGRNHYAGNEIKEKIVALTNQRNSLVHRWENLQFFLKVYQFEIREREKRKRQDEEKRRRAEGMAKKSPHKSPEDRPHAREQAEAQKQELNLQQSPNSPCHNGRGKRRTSPKNEDSSL